MDFFYDGNGCSLLDGNDAWKKRNQHIEEEDLTDQREWANRGPGALLPRDSNPDLFFRPPAPLGSLLSRNWTTAQEKESNDGERGWVERRWRLAQLGQFGKYLRKGRLMRVYFIPYSTLLVIQVVCVKNLTGFDVVTRSYL